MSGGPSLAETAGYRVEAPGGASAGTVAAVLPSVAEVPGVLLVHTGGDACTLTAVRFDQVDAVDSRGRRIVVRERSHAPRRRTRARRSASAPRATRGSATRMSRSVGREVAVPKTR